MPGSHEIKPLAIETLPQALTTTPGVLGVPDCRIYSKLPKYRSFLLNPSLTGAHSNRYTCWLQWGTRSKSPLEQTNITPRTPDQERFGVIPEKERKLIPGIKQIQGHRADSSPSPPPSPLRYAPTQLFIATSKGSAINSLETLGTPLISNAMFEIRHVLYLRKGLRILA